MMDTRETLHKKIDDLLLLLSNNNSRLNLHEEQLSQLDIDVLRKQCIDLYDCINRLALGGKMNSSIPREKSDGTEVMNRVSTDQIPTKQKKSETEKKPKEKKINDEAEMISLFDKFNSKPIDKIASAISISKRFEFQNNFFDGDAGEYKKFIDLVENAEDRESAFVIYHEYKNRLKWEQEELKDELKSLFYRKYSG